MKHIIFLLLFLQIPFFCHSQKTMTEKIESYLMSDMDTVKYEPSYPCENDNSYFSDFYMEGKSVIPLLIDVIDMDEQGSCGFYDVRSSFYFPLHNYRGQRSVYMLEYLLSDESRKKLSGCCVIAKRRNTESQLEKLDLNDMKIIKQIYKSWWEKNKNKSI